MKKHKADRSGKSTEATMARAAVKTKHLSKHLARPSKDATEDSSIVVKEKNPKKMPSAKSRTAEISRSALAKNQG
ncbi:MAG: hypothetical protein ACXWQO_16655 [Bdellovibrionota bacterium]